MTAAEPCVVVSNGFSRFHLATAAAELERRGLLARLLTGAYPSGAAWRLACALGLDHGRKLDRLARRGEDIPDGRIDALWSAEAVQVLGGLVRRLPVPAGIGDRLDVAGYRLYGWFAGRAVRDVDAAANIYHYRSGFGQESVEAARRRGMVPLCDHSIAHPRLVEYLVANGGSLPPPGVEPSPNRFWTNVLRDVERADHVLVNSDFVKRTFLHQGWPPERVHAIYLGTDDRFLDHLPPRAMPPGGPLRLLFAGTLEPRKGADVLVEALAALDDLPWRLEIAAGIAPEIARRHARFLADPRVHCHGVLSRTELGAVMASAEVFVFPTLAEGSARVIFEAMAAGCFVVTTENAGSVVVDRRDGMLVPPGDPAALRAAIREAYALGDRRAAIGAANAALIRGTFRQSHYGEALATLYRSLLRCRPAPG